MLKIWAILVEYTPRGANKSVRERQLLDLALHQASPDIKEMVKEREEAVKEHTAIHANFFTMMGMEMPHVYIIDLPPLTTNTGRRLLFETLNQQVTATIVQADFDALFGKIDAASHKSVVRTNK